MPNGVKLIGGANSGNPGSDRVAGLDGSRGIFVMSPSAAPTSVEITKRQVTKWNTFFSGETTDAQPGDPRSAFCLFHHEPMVTTPIIQVVWMNRNHDIFFLCGSFSARNPDFLYDTYHSSQDQYDGNDDSGIVNPGLDKLLSTIKFYSMLDYELLAYNVGDDPEKIVDAGTVFTVAQPADILDVKIERCDKTGVYYQYLILGVDYTLVGTTLTIINDITLYPGDALEINYEPNSYYRIIFDPDFYRDVVWIVDWKIFYLAPQTGVYGRDYYDIFKPGHEGWVEMPGYGAGAYQLPWTWNSIHETGIPVGGSMKGECDGLVVTLNPIKAKWVYEAQILNRIYEGLITRNGYTGAEMPWIALSPWTETPWMAPGDVNGQIVRFHIRNDVTWQDGTPVNATSIKWNYDYIASICPDLGKPMPEYFLLTSVYINTTIVDAYTVDIYMNTTGHWKTLDFAGVGLQFPQVIWQNLLTYTDRTAFQPWKVEYATQVGSPPPNGLAGLSCLMGTGPFFLNLTMGGWDEVNRIAYLSKYTGSGYWKRLANPGDVDMDMDVDEFDYWFFCARFIDYYKPPYLAHVLVDYDRNNNINELDFWFFCARFIDYYKYGLHGP
jgi:hypothetical protein